MTLRPVEWDLGHPLSGHPLAVIRLVRLGPRLEPYYRAVTANPERSARKLIGYWGTLEDARTGCLALYERATGESVAGGDAKPSMQVVQQKPPPPAHEPGSPARPRQHAARA